MQAPQETAIEGYVSSNLTPQEEERTMIKRRYDQLKDLLKGQTFRSGSYPRRTANPPVNDLDVIWELPEDLLVRKISANELQKTIDPLELNVGRILHDLAGRLEEEYRTLGIYVRIIPQSHSVGIYFGKTDDEFSIDLVPAIPTSEANEFNEPIYLVPDIALMGKRKRSLKYAEHSDIGWVKSDPRGYKEAARLVNEDTAVAREAAKIVKAWKRSCKKRDGTFPLKSFHLEIMAYDVVSRDLTLSRVAALEKIFRLIPQCLDSPHYADRANPESYVDGYVEKLTPEMRSLIKGEVAQALTLASSLGAETSPAKVDLLLDRLTGKPSPSLSRLAPIIVPAVSRPYHAAR
jgi:hypothetical protein